VTASAATSAGGLVGENSGHITDSYAIGYVGNDALNVGGLVGHNTGGSYTNDFWDKDTSGQSSSAGGTGETTANMMTESTYTSGGWDFTNTWGILEGTSYPYLLAANPSTPRIISGQIADLSSS